MRCATLPGEPVPVPATGRGWVPVLASTGVVDLVDGPVREGRVAYARGSAAHLLLDPPPAARGPDVVSPDVVSPDVVSPDVVSPDVVSPDVVSLVGAGGRVLPHALLVRGPLPALAHGDRAWVGGGEVRVGPVRFRVHRCWDPPRPRLSDRNAAARAAAALHLPALPVEPPWAAPLRRATTGLAVWLAAGRDGPGARAAVDGLLGLGPGLTPAGDDVLAGALVTLVAAADPRAVALRTGVRAGAPRRTTAVSAALLRHAGRGECGPELADLLRALAGGADPVVALDRLCAVGHSSGAALAWGVLLALDPTRPPQDATC